MRRLGVVLLLLAGCSSGHGSATGPLPTSLTIVGDAAKMWHPMRAEVAAGPVTLRIRSTGKIHDFRIAGSVQVDSGPIYPGQTRVLHVTMPAGTYHFRCHYHHAMTGTLIVR